ncbi:MAG: SDR family oxidoreductase [Byssovorax sp.]
MRSLYDAADAQRALDRWAPAHGEDLALRAYTARLFAQERTLALGGGSVSVKSRITDLFGEAMEGLHIDGGAGDLGAIEPRSFAACRLGPLRRLGEQPALGDAAFAHRLRAQRVDPDGPAPSADALLHAFLPAKFVDHLHAEAVLALVDQPRSAELVREVYGDRALFVPYVASGLPLARRVAELWQARALSPPSSRGGEPISSPMPSSRRGLPSVIVLDKHGIITFGDTAQQSYERMIGAVGLAEAFFDERRAASSRRTLSVPPGREIYARVGPVVRGALGRASGASWVGVWRTSPSMLGFTEHAELLAAAQLGCAAPDHAARVKARPLVLKVPPASEGATALRARADAALAGFVRSYRDYLRKASALRPGERREIDPFPRIVLVEGLGMLAVGKSQAEAAAAADLYERAAIVIEAASSVEGYRPAAEVDLFDVEHAAASHGAPQGAFQGAPSAAGAAPLQGKIALVTGASGAVGLAAARALLAAGAHVLLSDPDPAALDSAAAPLSAAHPERVLGIACDTTIDDEVRAAVSAAAEGFGGLDLVVSSAGRPTSGALSTGSGDAALRASIDVNLLGHQNVARAASELMIAQGTGGALLFDASFAAHAAGASGLPGLSGLARGADLVAQAALLALMRRYAAELAPHGVRAAAVSAEQLRAEAPLKAEPGRAAVIQRDTTANDVAQALLFLATAEAASGCEIVLGAPAGSGALAHSP